MSSIHSHEYVELISRLIKARKDAGLTQFQVAKVLKKPQSYVSKIETCQRRVDILEIKLLAKIYKVKLENLL